MAKTNEGDINSRIDSLGKQVSAHDNQIATIQMLTTLGFIIALITLAGVVIAGIAFAYAQVNQSTQQTRLLQEIKDEKGN